MTRALAALVLVMASPAFASSTYYGWLPQTSTLQSDQIELASSIYEHVDLGPNHQRSTSLLWTPAVGLTPSLELALPVELATRTQDDAAPWSGIGRYGAELRWSLPPHGGALHTLARFALSRDVTVYTQLRSEVELAASYDVGRVQVEADLGGALDVNLDHLHGELHPGVGASALVVGQLRLGAEFHGELSGDATATTWMVVGPDLAWQRDHFWLSAAFGIGIKHITAAPRLNAGLQW